MVIIMKIEEKIENVLTKIRPFLQNDGGDIEFIKYNEGIVYVKFIGACSNCPMMNATLTDGVKIALLEEIPEVIDVVLADNFNEF